MDTVKLLAAKRDSLLSQISEVGEFRPGNFLKSHRKCGSLTCHCARDGDPGHPGWQLTRKVKNRTITRRIPAHAEQTTRRQVNEYQRFSELMHELTEVS